MNQKIKNNKANETVQSFKLSYHLKNTKQTNSYVYLELPLTNQKQQKDPKFKPDEHPEKV